jgi:quercetin dioxygenase-like cupin family protein
LVVRGQYDPRRGMSKHVTSETPKVKYLRGNTGRTFAHLGSSISFKSEPDENGDRLLLFECRMPPGEGVPVHWEHNYESFYVLEGILQVEADGERYLLNRGDFFGMQAGVVHALLNPGPDWLRALMLVAPGSQHVRFFERLGEPLDDPLDPPPLTAAPDFAELAAVARECGMEFLEPGSGPSATPHTTSTTNA